MSWRIVVAVWVIWLAACSNQPKRSSGLQQDREAGTGALYLTTAPVRLTSQHDQHYQLQFWWTEKSPTYLVVSVRALNRQRIEQLSFDLPTGAQTLNIATDRFRPMHQGLERNPFLAVDDTGNGRSFPAPLALTGQLLQLPQLQLTLRFVGEVNAQAELSSADWSTLQQQLAALQAQLAPAATVN
ncbi:hypothetical protein HPT27_00555 [Permianibacter sp. IMCC34836]|uniref:hypothetical protein n=1 Tax=Permianibacter fluminis TaxID=2738515 RepID=UPI001557F319|nr:hypothetical protein [Permianibacter fluminis]NQD35492.1 hypothetical protein [Permianibacter fluminis]